MTFDLDLPHPKVAKPAAAKDDLELDLGPPAADLPAPLAELPSIAASLPTKKAEPAFGEIDLPSLDASLPQVASALPAVANVLPTVGQQLPAPVADARLMPVQKETLDFGEVDLGPPLQQQPAPPPPAFEAPLLQVPISSPPKESAFAELDLSGADLKSLPPSHPPAPPAAPPPMPPPPPVVPQASAHTGNALAYGEVDLGGQTMSADEASIGMEAPAPPPQAPPMAMPPPSGGDELALPEAPARTSGAPGASELSLPIETGRKRPEREESTEPSRAPRIFFLLLILVLAAGGALQATKHGAFGYLTIGDMLHAKDYKSFTVSSSNAARTRASKDVFLDTRGSIDDLFAAHWKMPRATGLAAYTAFAEFAYETRFGGDVDRNAKAKLLLSDLGSLQDVQYYNVALAAEDAASGQIEKARKGLDAASKRDAGDPIQRDIALLRGEVELEAKDPKAAKTAFDAAIKLGANAQAHYGLARAANMQRDWATVATECDATLSATPHHPGALLLRALQRYTAKGDDTNALVDLAEITDGPAKALASTAESAQAFANRGEIFFRVDARVTRAPRSRRRSRSTVATSTRSSVRARSSSKRAASPKRSRDSTRRSKRDPTTRTRSRTPRARRSSSSD